MVLVMSALIGMSAMLLFSTTNMETMIAGNIRRMNQAKISAASGLNHFRALGLTYGTLRRRAGDLQMPFFRVDNNKTKLLIDTPRCFMITKTLFWQKIVQELKEVERNKKVTADIMKKIKEIPQDEKKGS